MADLMNFFKLEHEWNLILFKLDREIREMKLKTFLMMQIFEMDQECISALVTFEHLSSMCQSEHVPSPIEVRDR
jgi:hypothetical protein